MPLKEDVLITVELDTEQLDLYNYRQYGNELNKHAKLLSHNRYTIPSTNIIIKAGDVGATTFFPIEVDANGLSPDTTYIVPVKIKSANGYDINENKILYCTKLIW